MPNKILALSNLVTDVIHNVSDEQIQKLGLEKGRFHIAGEKQFEILRKMSAKGAKVPGGAAANVVSGAALLGAKTAIIGTLGRDLVGALYKSDLKRRRVECFLTEKDGTSGVCHTFITPDGDRTFALDFGVALQHSIKEKAFEGAEIFHTTGYEFEGCEKAVRKAVEIAKSSGVKITFDLADSNLVRRHAEGIKELCREAHIIFASEEEARAFTGKVTPDEALGELAKFSKIAVVKLGEKGSLVRSENETYEIPALKLERFVNSNGAGDAYAAGFLAAHIAGKGLREAGEEATKFAARVCECEGARVE